jgi:hypothetical protein
MRFVLQISKGKGLGPVHKSTGPVEILTLIQFLYICQDLNGFNAPVHWTQAAPISKSRKNEYVQFIQKWECH